MHNSYNEARAAIDDRQALTENVLNCIEADLELLCLTGVEDKLQVLRFSGLFFVLNAFGYFCRRM